MNFGVATACYGIGNCVPFPPRQPQSVPDCGARVAAYGLWSRHRAAMNGFVPQIISFRHL